MTEQLPQRRDIVAAVPDEEIDRVDVRPGLPRSGVVTDPLPTAPTTGVAVHLWRK
ncbi:MAG TPA: hypothetical protein VMR14_04160 [Streptosporangiaceae bacterium]|nr:hypothetical protein [Streptosporangiaceae bacterium]